VPDRVADFEVAELASRLRSVVGQLVRRYRQDRTLPTPQVTAMSWIERQGPLTTSRLAALERVRPQSMAHTVGRLQEAGLVERRPDPVDGRQALIELTRAGAAAMDTLRRAGESWVAEALAAGFTSSERAELARGVELLGRLVSD
jgi:DNA-binding MarR family transcriptional regulator